METKRVFTVFTAICVALSVVASIHSKNNLVGTWQYNDGTLPYGYQNGIISIGEKGDALFASLLSQGYEIKAEKVTMQGDKANALFNIEGAQISVILEKSGNGVVAKTDLDGSIIHVKCEQFNLFQALEGKWTAQVSNAPYGYQKAEVTFTKGVPTVKMDGYNVPVSSFKSDLLKVTFYVTVEGESVSVSLDWKGNNLAGNASYNGENFRIVTNRQAN